MRIFVYGTLKRGQRNHARFCQGILSAQEATVLGQLYNLPAGYPMLRVPPSAVLAMGTADYLADERRELALSHELNLPAQPSAEPGDWTPIAGEILTFDRPELCLPPLDQLENFVPGGASLYDRVLLHTLSPDCGLVWTYIASGGRLPHGAVRIGSVWP